MPSMVGVLGAVEHHGSLLLHIVCALHPSSEQGLSAVSRLRIGILVLVQRPPRDMREAIRQGSLGDGNHRVGFVFTPLTSGEVAATRQWENIIHLSVAASGTLAAHQ